MRAVKAAYVTQMADGVNRDGDVAETEVKQLF